MFEFGFEFAKDRLRTGWSVGKGVLFGLFLLGQVATVEAQQPQVYIGYLHSHSTFSWDAQPSALPPAEAYSYAWHVAGLDFLAITDHTNGLTRDEYEALKAAAARYDDPDSQFVAIAGQELGAWGSSGYGHLNLFEPPGRADNASNDSTRRNLGNAYGYIDKFDLLAQFNHPRPNGSSNFNNFEYVSALDDNLQLLEILNGKRSEDYELYWLRALSEGWYVGVSGDQDNHDTNYGTTVSNAGDIYLTGVLADSLTKPKIMEALRNRRTFAFMTSPASDRIYITEFTADGNWVGDVFTQSDNQVELRVAARAETPFLSVQLYKNAHLLAMETIDTNSFEWSYIDDEAFGENYYFVKLVQRDADIAWTSPIWVNSPGSTVAPADTVVPIAQLRPNTQDGIPMQLGRTNVKVRGIVTAGSQFGARGPGFLQDSTGGVAVYGDLFAKSVVPGFEVEVVGAVDFFNGLIEFSPYSVKRVGVKTEPEPIVASTGDIAANGENYEGLLVRVTGVTISGAFPGPGSNANLIIDDGSGPLTLRIDKDTDIPGHATPSGPVEIVGIVSQYDLEPPYDSGYQLMPRQWSDIVPVTAVELSEETEQELPQTFELYQNYPNPLRTAPPYELTTEISYQLFEDGPVSLTIHNVRGEVIRTLVTGMQPRGEYRVQWDGLDQWGRPVVSGLYFYQLRFRDQVKFRKMLVMR
jgi:hypothetical protein